MFRALIVLTLCVLPLPAQTTQEKFRRYREVKEAQILHEFIELLSIPNVAADTPNIRRNADFILGMMKQRGLEPRLLEAPTPNTPPAVYAEWKTPGAARTLLLYAHYDGQPTDPKQWTVTQPWTPLMTAERPRPASLPNPGSFNPEARIYARSASDDKAGVMAILNAFAALKAKNIPLTSNIKFLFEGEEEAGSPHLGEIIKANRELRSEEHTSE